jgi:acetyl esterase
VVRLIGYGAPPLSARDELELDWLNGDVTELRSAYERACRCDTDQCAWIDIGGSGGPLRVLVHEPARPAAHGSAIIYFHGGGWIVGSPLTHADISGALCDETGLRVMSVDYRLAPEHKAPAPIEDGLRALDFFLGRDRLDFAFVCGDSAGGAVALAVERFSTAATRARIAGVLSFYGAFGLTDSPSIRLYGRREQGLDSECIKRYWTLAHDNEGVSPYSIAALHADSPVAVYLQVCGHDPLRDDSLSLARALKAIGRDVALDMVESAEHGFLHGAKHSTPAGDAIKRAAAWIDAKRRKP